MSNKSKQTTQSERPPRLTVPRATAAEKLDAQLAKGRSLMERPFTEIDDTLNEFYRWHAYNKQLLSTIFDNPSVAENYERAVTFASLGPESIEQKLIRLIRDVDFWGNRLLSVREQLDLFDEPAPISSIAEAQAASVNRQDIFIVHGHDDAAKLAVARFIEKSGLHAIILHEQPNAGRTIIEKFEKNASLAGFAVVLLTPDDFGAKQGVPPEQAHSRARQNVILELGYFFGKLGRERVCALVKGDLETPSDIAGVVYEPMDSSDSWKLKLAQELKAAGFEIDLNKALLA